MIPRRALLIGLAAVALTACGDEADASKPPKIRLGKDTCDRCGMLISDERHAAALVDDAGAARLFDDAGELVMTAREEGVAGRRIWVHDDTPAWIDGTTAFYAVGQGAMTPMGTGVLVFATRDQAEAWANDHEGATMSWNEMLTQWNGTPGMGSGGH